MIASPLAEDLQLLKAIATVKHRRISAGITEILRLFVPAKPTLRSFTAQRTALLG